MSSPSPPSLTVSYGAFRSIHEESAAEEESPLLAPVSSSSSSAQKKKSTSSLLRRKSAASASSSSPPPLWSTTKNNSSSNSGNNNNKNNNSDKNDGSILVHRFLILLALVLIVCAAVYYQTRMNDLQVALQQEHEHVEQLQSTLEQHSQVIERFNTSVTNHDVILRLHRLEVDLQNTTSSLQHELKKVTADVSQKLDETLQLLNATVKAAQDEITTQVATVKLDLDDYMHTTQDQFSLENSFMVYQLAGTFTLLSCLISMWHITAHLRRMSQPDVQRKILAILWMSPLYAVTSWFSLVFHSAQGYLAIVKDGYEAYIIYQFLSFLIAVLGKGDRNAVVDLLAKRAHHLTPPFTLCFWRKHHYYDQDDRALADAILLQCQFFALQFVFFRPLTTTAMVVLDQLHYYGPNSNGDDGNNNNNMMTYQSPQAYITIIQNLSIFIAFTGLLKFYHAVDKDLAWCRPFAKFLCIKGVVFMTFWQGLAIDILAQMTDVGIQPGGADDVHSMESQQTEWAKSAQNFLICLEMLIFSIAHFYCFPTEEWEEGYKIKHSQGQFGDSIALGDFLADIKLIVSHGGGKRKRKKKPTDSGGGGGNGDDDENTQASRDDGDDNDDDINNNNNSSSNDHDVENPGHIQKPPLLPPPEPPLKKDQALIYKNDTMGAAASAAASRYNGSFGDVGEMDEDQRYVAMQLEKSLGVDLASQDPEIAEAAKRLLASHVLDPAFFDMAVTTTGSSPSNASGTPRGLLTDEMRQFLRENSLEDAYSDEDSDYDDGEDGEDGELDPSIKDDEEDMEADADLQHRSGNKKNGNSNSSAKQLFDEHGPSAAGAAAVSDIMRYEALDLNTSAREETNAEDKKHKDQCMTSVGKVEKKETTKTGAGSAISNEKKSRAAAKSHERDAVTPPTNTTAYRPDPTPGPMMSPNETTSFSLRPSIFTTVASLAEQEVDADEKKDRCGRDQFT